MEKLTLKVQHEMLNYYRICDIQHDIWAIRWGTLLRGEKLYLVGITDRAREGGEIMVKPCGNIIINGVPKILRDTNNTCCRIKYWERVAP